jgi:hypothetical protein
MIPVSRRAILAFGAAICCPATSFAASIEPILRNPGVLIADVSVTWVTEEPEPLWPTIADPLSSEAHSFLYDAVRKAKSPLIVLQQPLVLLEDPYHFSPLHVKVGLALKSVAGAKPTMGTVSLRFERLGFEPVPFAQAPTRFLATNYELLIRAGEAIREQLAAFVHILAEEEARRPVL